MSTHGKTLRIYLADGSPTGIRHAEVVNWTGQAIVCPRGRIGALSKWPESQRPGLYILHGEDPKGTGPMAYIGEAENVLTRLKQHVAGEKDFWDQVVFFTSKDENLTKAHVKYLESRVVEMAKTAKRVALGNSTAPTQSTLPRPDCEAMEEFLEPARILLGVLGFHFLEPILTLKKSGASQSNYGPLANTTLYFEVSSKRPVKAEGLSTDEGFVVAEGAVGPAEVLKSLPAGYDKIRRNLIQDGAIAVVGDRIRFTKNILFRGSSAAASVVCSGMRNGRDAWKNSEGIPLSELEDALLGTTEPEGEE